MAELALVMNFAGTYRYVLVDLSECSFLDSTVVKTLLQAAELADERGGALALVAVDRSGDAVRRALEVLPVGVLVAVHPTRAAGIASFTSGTHTFRASVDDSSEVRLAEDRVACGQGPDGDAAPEPRRD